MDDWMGCDKVRGGPEPACSHRWIDPAELPIQRAPYSPVIGPGRREMKPGHSYRCQGCGDTLQIRREAGKP